MLYNRNSKFMKYLIWFLLFFTQFFHASYAWEINVWEVFRDIDENYEYVDELQHMYDQGIIRPDENGDFNPGDSLLRDEFVGIISEVGCENCIRPNTDFRLIQQYGNTPPFFDISVDNDHFYCVASAQDKWYIQGYQPGSVCQNGSFLEGESPFCPLNLITKEEALAVILRSSGIMSLSEAQVVERNIQNNVITEPLSSDVFPKNEDGSVNSFYPYISRALDYTYREVLPSWEEILYDLLDVTGENIFPGKYITREEFLRIAYIAHKSSDCRQISTDTLAVRMNIDSYACTQGSECNNTIKPDDTVFDLSSEVSGVCELWVENQSDYSWKMYHPASSTEIYEYGEYLDDYNFPISGMWVITNWVIDACWNTWEIQYTFFVGDIEGRWDTTPWVWLQIEADPLSGPGPLTVNMEGVIEWWDGDDYTYSWDFWDGNSSTGQQTLHTYDTSGVYEATLTATDSNGNQTNSYITIYVKESEQDSWVWLQIEADPLSGPGPLTVNMEGVIEWWDGDDYTYSWDFGDGNSSTGQQTSYTYSVPWSYEAILTATDSDGNTVTSQVTVYVEPSSSTLWVWLQIEADPLSGPGPLTVNMEGVIEWWDGDDYTYSWDFGDGNSSTGQQTTYTYHTPWTYEATLTATDSDGNTTTSQVTIQVEEGVSTPWVWLQIEADPLSGPGPLTVNMEGVIEWWDGDDYTYSWDFGDGNSSTGQQTSYTYSVPWSYEAILTATDSDGNTVTSQVTVYVEPSSSTLWVWLQIEADPLSGPGPLTVNMEGVIEWWDGDDYTYSWDFWDGNSSTGQQTLHTYDTSGVYEATLTATDSNGNQTNSYITIYVKESEQDSWVWLQIEADPLSGPGPLTVNMEGVIEWWDGDDYTYSWDFGDGNSSTGQQTSYTYSVPWSYEAILTATDSDGNTVTSQVTVYVEPSSSTLWVWLQIEADPLSGPGPLTVNMEGVIEWWDGDDYTYSWDFGDGNSSTGQQTTYTYHTPWTYEATLTATDSDGNTTTSQVTIQVEEGVSTPWVWLQIEADPLSGPGPLTVNMEGVIEWWDGDDYTYSWDFWDGNSSTGQQTLHTYDTPGIYEATLTATDSDGNITTSQVTIEVVSSDLKATVEFDQQSENGPSLVDFEVWVIGGEGPYTYEWDFWDSTSGLGEEISHVYTDEGVYIAELIVTDIHWSQVIVQVWVLVVDEDCSIDSDGDGVNDCIDVCPLAAGEWANQWCPILEQVCDIWWESCPEWYTCQSNTSGAQVCLPQVIGQNCNYSWGSAILGNAVCNSCPCIYSFDFNASLRKCDVIIPAITSPDGSQIYSVGEGFQIQE